MTPPKCSEVIKNTKEPLSSLVIVIRRKYSYSEANAVQKAQGVYSDMYMTGGLGPGILWDTQKNK